MGFIQSLKRSSCKHNTHSARLCHKPRQLRRQVRNFIATGRYTDYGIKTSKHSNKLATAWSSYVERAVRLERHAGLDVPGGAGLRRAVEPAIHRQPTLVLTQHFSHLKLCRNGNVKRHTQDFYWKSRIYVAEWGLRKISGGTLRPFLHSRTQPFLPTMP